MSLELSLELSNAVATSDETTFQHGRKSALAKFCAGCISLLANGRLPNTSQLQGIDSFCAAIQLLDDLTDVTEDLVNGRKNFFNTLTMQWLRAEGLGEIEPGAGVKSDLLVYAIVQSGSAVEVLNRAARYLRNGIEEFPSADATCVAYFEEIENRCLVHSTKLQRACSDIPRLGPCELRRLHNEGSDRLSPHVDAFSQQIQIAFDLIRNAPKASQ